VKPAALNGNAMRYVPIAHTLYTALEQGALQSWRARRAYTFFGFRFYSTDCMAKWFHSAYNSSVVEERRDGTLWKDRG